MLSPRCSPSAPSWRSRRRRSAATTTLTGVVQLLHADARTPGAPAQFFYALRHDRRPLPAAARRRLVADALQLRARHRHARAGRCCTSRASTPRDAGHGRRARARRPRPRGRRAALADAGRDPDQLLERRLDAVDAERRSRTRCSTTRDSVAAYYAEQSHGKTMLTGTVFGWYTIAASNDTCDYATWAAQAQAAAGSAINAYSNVMYVFPFVPACGWAGLGSMPGLADLDQRLSRPARDGARARPQLRRAPREQPRVHRRAARASRWRRRGCSSDEYGDPFTIMGDASTRQFPAFHKGELGWLQGDLDLHRHVERHVHDRRLGGSTPARRSCCASRAPAAPCTSTCGSPTARTSTTSCPDRARSAASCCAPGRRPTTARSRA